MTMPRQPSLPQRMATHHAALAKYLTASAFSGGLIHGDPRHADAETLSHEASKAEMSAWNVVGCAVAVSPDELATFARYVKAVAAEMDSETEANSYTAEALVVLVDVVLTFAGQEALR